jgi:hypothetical protein
MKNLYGLVEVRSNLWKKRENHLFLHVAPDLLVRNGVKLT